jgi:two-component system, cell cycle sensor histidine kinase and response regulator CckA
MTARPALREQSSLGKTTHAPKSTANGTETILLVEDEGAVRALSRHGLKMFGYTVLEATRGREAIRIVEQHQG